MRFLQHALAAVAITGFAAGAHAQDVTGAGASFPFPVYAKWAEAYNKAGGVRVNYQSIGSGGGIRQIQARTVTFGATDAPLSGADLDKGGLVQFPTVLGGVVPVVNIAGVESGKLRLTGEVLAAIYMGEIRTWNDKRIAELNTGVTLPGANITPVYRSDGSGTTSIFTTYLSETSPAWKDKLGSGTTVNWPVGQGGKGNEGVAATTKQVVNSIGYVEYAYAKQNKLAVAMMQNKDGQFVAPDAESFAAAAAGADWNAAPGFGISLTSQPGARSWPITGATFILMHREPKDPKAAAEALKFFDWAFKNGAKMAEELDYVALPAKTIEQIRSEALSRIKVQ